MANLFFKSEGHRERLLESIQAIGKVHNGELDQEYGSALYILTADYATWKKAEDYVSSDGIHIETMLAEVDFSGGYGVLIQLAGNLFNGHQHLDPLEFMRLDESNFLVALTSLIIRRQSLTVEEVMNHG